LKWEGDFVDGKGVDGLLGTVEEVESVGIVLLLSLNEGLKLGNQLSGFEFIEIHDGRLQLLSSCLVLVLAHDLAFFSQSKSQIIMLLVEVVLALLLSLGSISSDVLFSGHGGDVQLVLEKLAVLNVRLVEVSQEPGELVQVVANVVGVKLSQLELKFRVTLDVVGHSGGVELMCALHESVTIAKRVD